MLEAWMILWLGILQLAIAAWWWQGPHLEGTRGWGAALFLLNGLATLAAALHTAEPYPMAEAIRRLLDRGTNLTLFGLAVVALPSRWVGSRTRRILTSVVGIAFLVALPVYFWDAIVGVMGAPGADLAKHLVEAPLLLAIALLPLGFQRALREPHDRTGQAWTAVLAVLGFRYAEIVGLYLMGRLPRIIGFTVGTPLRDVLSLAALLGVLGSALVLGRRVLSPDADVHVTSELALVLLLGGFAWGFSRHLWSIEPYTLTIFSLALLRPAGFLGSQAFLDGGPHPRLPHARPLVGGTSVFLVSLAGVFTADVLWHRPPVQSAVFGTVLALAALPLTRFTPEGEYPAPRPDPAASHATQPAGDASPALDPDPAGLPPSLVEAVETDRVTLPGDWRERLGEAWTTYRDLPASTRAAVRDLPQWTRLLLALRVATDDGKLPAYERTTPGLHLQTQCAYSGIGPEINRANERWRDILDEVGVSPPTRNGNRSDALVESSWGRAEGLDSPRVKFYGLTALGREVADAILEDVGLELGMLQEAPCVVGAAVSGYDAARR